MRIENKNIEKHQRIVEAITEKAKTIAPKGAEVILFGSQARGDARADSDWDILMLIDKDDITFQDIDDYTYPLRELGWDYDACINTVLYTKKDWQHDVASPFVENVTREGIRLWG